jgi:hypothetical protein
MKIVRFRNNSVVDYASAVDTNATSKYRKLIHKSNDIFIKERIHQYEQDLPEMSLIKFLQRHRRLNLK